jgi:hypothetical protein
MTDYNYDYDQDFRDWSYPWWHRDDCNIGLTEGEAEALLITLFGVLKLYPGRILRIKGDMDKESLTIEVYANEDWPDYCVEGGRLLKSFDALDPASIVTRPAALAELGLTEDHPVIDEPDKLSRPAAQD